MKKVLLLLLLASPAMAKEDDFGGASVVYAKGTSLWKTDPKGKGPDTEVAKLAGKAEDVRMIRSDPSGKAILFDEGGTWYTAVLGASPATPTKLACADAPARFTQDGASVVCADADGHAMIVPLDGSKVTHTKVPAAGARVVDKDLVWADNDGVWRAPLADLAKKTQLAKDAPVSGFAPSPDGKRAIAIYPGHVYDHKQKVAADVLATFALDGTASRRMLFRDGVVVDWSWDSQWLLLQHGDYACITRAVGGEYKCWKGYTPVSISPDGKWGLLLGPKSEAKVKDDGRNHGKDEDADDSGETSDPANDGSDPQATAASTGLPARPFSLFRAKLEGAYTEHPSVVEIDDDGAALWLPVNP